MVKKILKTILIIILILILVIVGYFVYVFAAYHRIDDNQSLTVQGSSKFDSVKTDTNYRIVSSNIGFGAYSDDFSFFMDGGTESWAFSKDAVVDNTAGSVNEVLSLKPDFMLFQEVDTDSTRSYHVDQNSLIIDDLSKNGLDNINHLFAVNYDSPFLMYPLTKPMGISKSGVLTISQYAITDGIRRSLPIEEGFSKLVDLDRCYSKAYFPVDGGKQLVMYNTHLSAYTTDPTTTNNQVKMLNEDMRKEFSEGNYIIVGGDMNKDVLGNSDEIFGAAMKEIWAQPFPVDLLDKDFKVIRPVDEKSPIASCRYANKPYTKDSYVLTVDGFIVSSNVEVIASDVCNTEFKYSDHNPVYMDFKLK